MTVPAANEIKAWAINIGSQERVLTSVNYGTLKRMPPEIPTSTSIPDPDPNPDPDTLT